MSLFLGNSRKSKNFVRFHYADNRDLIRVIKKVFSIMGHNLWPINYRPYMVFSWALYHYPREKVARLSESRFLDILSVTRRHNLWDAENASGG